MIDDPERLRDRATRLLALAIVALEESNGEFANHLTGMASEVLFHAEEIERRYRPWPPDASPQYAAQRHQEIMLESKLAIFRAETCLSLPGQRPWYLTAAVMPCGVR